MKTPHTHSLKSIVFAIYALLAGVCGYAATGASTATPYTYAVGQTKSFTLVNDGEGDGVAYLKVALKRGTPYTFWTTNITSVNPEESAYIMGFDVIYTYLFRMEGEAPEVMEGYLSSSGEDERSENYRAFITADDWEWMIGEDETPTGYYLLFTGEIGESFTLASSQGIVEETIPTGTFEKPVNLPTPTTDAKTTAATKITVDGDYNYLTTLTAGQRYRFTTQGGTTALPLTVSVSGSASTLITLNDEGATDGDVYVIPTVTGAYYITVGGKEGQSFQLTYQATPARLPAEHTPAFTLSPTTEGSTFTALPINARNDSGDAFYDNVIDTSLLRLSLQYGHTYLVTATYANDASAGKTIMEVYNAAGEIIQKNLYGGIMPFGQALSFTPPQTGDYWVGIGQNVPESADAIAGLTANVTVKDLGILPAAPNSTPAEAIALIPAFAPAMSIDSIISENAFSAANSTDWYRFDCAGNTTNHFAAVSPAYIAQRPMNLSIYTLSSKGALTLVEKDLDPQNPVSFIPTKGGTYYLKLTLPDGTGCDYPYTFHAWVDPATHGILSITIMGAADGTCNMKGESAAKYVNGANVVITAGEKTAQFATVKGWTKPVDSTFTVVAGEIQPLYGKYSDTSDPKDDLLAGATTLALSTKLTSLNRSLWSNDARDLYKLAVKNGIVYSLNLSSVQGNPTIRVYSEATQAANGAINGLLIASGSEIRFTARETATYVVELGHEDPYFPTDSAYVLNGLAQNVGTVSIEKTAYTVKEGTAKIDIKVTRSAKEGAIRVRYSTFEDTARAGQHYEPASGYLTWADGDSAAKTISITLIPDLTPAWNPDRTFTLALDLVPEDLADLTALAPLLATGTASITITEVTKASPGTLGFSGQGDLEAEPFANAKSPAATVAAGDRLTLWIARTAGADGETGVLVETIAKTAKADEHFTALREEMIWADGDLTPKSIDLETLFTDESFAPDRTFTVKLTALKTTEATAKLGAGTVTVTIRDASVAQSFSEWVLTPEIKASGLTIKDPANAWFIDQGGDLRSTKALTLTVTVPSTSAGLLSFNSALMDAASTETFTGTLGKETFDLAENNATVKYLAAKGTLTFTAKASTAGSEAYAAFFANGDSPFQWIPAAPATLIAPADKSVSDMGTDDFLWSGFEGATFRFLLDPIAKNLDASPLYSEDLTETEVCLGCTMVTLTPGKTYSWRVDTLVAMPDGSAPVILKGAVRTFTMPASGAPRTQVMDADGTTPLAPDSEMGAVSFQLVQGLAASITCGLDTGSASATYSVISGKLPDGLKIAQNIISGVPTKAGSFSATVQAKGAASLTLAFTVAPMNLAAGTFAGTLSGTPDAAGEPTQQLDFAGASFTAAATGKLTAKINWGGKSHAFSGTGFAEDVPDIGNGLPGLRARLTAAVKINNVTYTNVFDATFCRAAATEPGALDTPAIIHEVTLHLAPRTAKTGVLACTFTEGSLYRNNAKVPESLALAQQWVGYYTVAMPFENGAAYATFTLDAKGGVKLSGVLPSGSFAASATPAFFSEGEVGAPFVRIPFHTGTATAVSGGEITIFEDARTGEIVVSGDLAWGCVDPKTAPEGIFLAAPASGGFYDKLVNLQTFYKDYLFEAGLDEAPIPAGLNATYSTLAYRPSELGMPFTFSGNAISMPKRTLVKNGKLNNFEASINPSNLAIKITRATGLFSGTFGLWYEGTDSKGVITQKEQSVKFQGVLLLSQPSDSPYADRPGLGFANIPAGLGSSAATALFSLNATERGEWEAEALPEL